ncbi:hypothetical protein [Cupriavidus sp. L7L]|nr:hypothetical protein [Cupriavidus sp. L7L]
MKPNPSSARAVEIQLQHGGVAWLRGVAEPQADAARIRFDQRDRGLVAAP